MWHAKVHNPWVKYIASVRGARGSDLLYGDVMTASELGFLVLKRGTLHAGLQLKVAELPDALARLSCSESCMFDEHVSVM